MRFVETFGPPQWPSGRCAGCGTTTGPIEPRRARLAKTEVAALPGFAYGTERRVVFQVPLCEGCAPTASRLRPTGAQYVVVWGGLALLGFLAIIPLGGYLPNSLLAICGLPALVATLLSVAWYASRRPPGDAKSHYQPVFLRAGSRDSLILGFCHDDYAADFAAANPGSRIGSAVKQRKLVAG